VRADGDLVELGRYSRLSAQILRHRLETAGIPVMSQGDEQTVTTGAADRLDDGVLLLVPLAHAEFAWAVVNEIDVDDEVPDTSPHAYVARIEEHLSAVAELLDEMRSRLDELERDGKL